MAYLTCFRSLRDGTTGLIESVHLPLVAKLDNAIFALEEWHRIYKTLADAQRIWCHKTADGPIYLTADNEGSWKEKYSAAMDAAKLLMGAAAPLFADPREHISKLYGRSCVEDETVSKILHEIASDQVSFDSFLKEPSRPQLVTLTQFVRLARAVAKSKANKWNIADAVVTSVSEIAPVKILNAVDAAALTREALKAQVLALDSIIMPKIEAAARDGKSQISLSAMEALADRPVQFWIVFNEIYEKERGYQSVQVNGGRELCWAWRSV